MCMPSGQTRAERSARGSSSCCLSTPPTTLTRLGRASGGCWKQRRAWHTHGTRPWTPPALLLFAWAPRCAAKLASPAVAASWWLLHAGDVLQCLHTGTQTIDDCGCGQSPAPSHHLLVLTCLSNNAGSHQCAAGAKGRAHRSGGHPRLPGSAAHRQPGAAARLLSIQSCCCCWDCCLGPHHCKG